VSFITNFTVRTAWGLCS